MKESARKIKMHYERNAQPYVGKLDEKGGPLVEDFSRIRFKPYSKEQPLSNIIYAKENINLRVRALLGYRNGLAMEMDHQAKIAELEIIADELRVAGFAFNPNSEQTPA
jgi:hypothetical protein